MNGDDIDAQIVEGDGEVARCELRVASEGMQPDAQLATNNSQLATCSDAAYVPLVARVPVSVRVGTMEDVPFIDAQQKANGRALGFLQRAAIEGKVRAGQVLVAEMQNDECRMPNE